MAYTPVNWQTGDTITADRLNRMDRGWSVDSTQLFSETVTTADDGGVYSATLAFSQAITANSITVTYDGTEYTCPSIGAGEYGAPFNGSSFDFSEFPFNLYTSSGNPASFISQTAGEHTVAASIASIETSSSFDSAVVLAGVFEVVSGTTTFQEACDAFKSGKHVCVVVNSSSGITYREPVILVNENTFEIKFVSTTNNGTQISLSTLAASSADGVLG